MCTHFLCNSKDTGCMHLEKILEYEDNKLQSSRYLMIQSALRFLVFGFADILVCKPPLLTPSAPSPFIYFCAL